ncbi:MAG: hypothetical protein IIC36_07650 [Gemmatimonadetes bacterium]|nr:hypothetical protein [Gemmatimonadota bacterium]
MNKTRASLCFGAAALMLPLGSSAHARDDPMQHRLDPVAFLEWREVGPAVVGGRVSDLAVDEADTRIIYVGTATSGIWKSTNHGTTWVPIFTDQSTSSIGDVTLAPSDPNVVWVGTGEPQNRQSSPWGDGVFRSMDGGRTWAHKGLRETRHISRIQVHPRDPDIAYVAAVGNLWRESPERGVYKTLDGGDSWELVLHLDDHTGAIDLAMDPSDPNTLFAAMYSRRRTAWGFNGGGPGSGIYRTVDGGASWTHLQEGLPEGELGRIGLDIYRRDGNLVFATVQAGRGQTGLYGSTDGGDSWEKLSGTNPRPMYFSLVRVDPNDPERIYLGGTNLMRSDDGGRTFTDEGARNVHLDHHALWIDPSESNHLLLGSDGGVSTSFDGSETWRFYDNLPIAQFYEIGFDNRRPYWVCGGLQDNGTWCGPTNTLDNQGIRNGDWRNVGGGDGFYVQIDPTDPTVLYVESQNGSIRRLDADTGERAAIRPTPRFDLDEGTIPKKEYPSDDDLDPAAREYRFNWNTPLVISAHDPNTLYLGSQMLLRSTDRGLNWTQISPDLTFDIDRSQLPIMDVLPSDSMLSRHDGVNRFSTVTVVAESPLNPNVLYTGSDDGRVMGTQDGGATWLDLTENIRDLPDNTYVSRMVASNAEEGRVYASFDGHYSGDFAPYVYVSDDYGQRWRSITDGLPQTSVNVLTEHPDEDNLLFLGNEVGVFVSVDGGDSWDPLMSGLPTVPVDDVRVNSAAGDLLIGTHGRGIWVLDDIAPLEQLASGSVAAGTPYLFRGGQVIHWRRRNIQNWTASGEFSLANPPAGARLRYWIPPGLDVDGAEPSDEREDEDRDEDGDEAPDAGPQLEIKILTATGRQVRTLEGPATPGAHEVFWDFRMDPAYELQDNGPEGAGLSPRGPTVLPSVYQIRIPVGETTMFGDLTVRQDPRIEISRADLAARQTALIAMYDLQAPVYHARQAVERLNLRLSDAAEFLQETATAQTFGDDLAGIMEELADVDRELRRLLIRSGEERRARPAGTGRQIEASTTRPTGDQLQDVERAWRDAPEVIGRLNALILVRVPAFLRKLNDEKLPAEPGEHVVVPRRRGG